MAFSWSETVTTGTTEIKAIHWSELQTNTDWLNDNPGCGTNNSSVDAAADATVDAVADATIHAVADQGYDSSLNSDYNSSEYGTENYAREISANTSDLGSDYVAFV